MTTAEMLDYLKNVFECEHYDYSCEARDCIECCCFLDEIEEQERTVTENGKESKDF